MNNKRFYRCYNCGIEFADGHAHKKCIDCGSENITGFVRVKVKNLPKLEVKKHAPIVYRVYDYLKEHHLGAENGILRRDLAQALNLSVRKLRAVTAEINASTELEKLVSTSRSCYMCKTEQECAWAVHTTYAQAATLIKKAKTMETKVALNGQYKLPKLQPYAKECVETFVE